MVVVRLLFAFFSVSFHLSFFVSLFLSLFLLSFLVSSSLSSTRVDVYDGAKAQAELDAQVSRVACRSVGSSSASTRLQDLRLLLTGLGTLLACLAQFYPPGKYPHNFWGLALACPLYVLVNALVTWWLPAQEQDICCEISLRPNNTLTVRSHFDPEKHLYGLRTAKDGPLVTRRLGELFTETGFIRLKVLEGLVQDALKKK